MIRQIALLTLRADAQPEDVSSLEVALQDAANSTDGIIRSQASRHLPGSLCAHYTWDVALDSDATPSLEEVLTAPALADYFAPGSNDALVAHTDAVRFEPQHREILDPEIRDCIKRTLFLRVFPETPSSVRDHFERDIMRMPSYIPAIRNWSFSRADTSLHPTLWTHVWEQEYEDLEGLQGDYMMSPFHWGVIDGWFDPDCPKRIVENRFAHVFGNTAASVLTGS